MDFVAEPDAEKLSFKSQEKPEQAAAVSSVHTQSSQKAELLAQGTASSVPVAHTPVLWAAPAPSLSRAAPEAAARAASRHQQGIDALWHRPAPWGHQPPHPQLP